VEAISLIVLCDVTEDEDGVFGKGISTRFISHIDWLRTIKTMARGLITKRKWALRFVALTWMLIFCTVCGALLIIRIWSGGGDRCCTLPITHEKAGDE
jgi:hypothetical protein